MKKFIILLAAVMLPMLADAQAQINTKKVKVSDLTGKVTKVVLTGNDFYDNSIKNEITAGWRISPFEFCTLKEFETLKESDQYYFLILAAGQFKKETAPGIQFLTLVKGGKGSDKGISEMLEVVSFPFSSVQFPSGREFIFLPAIMDIIQEQALAAMKRDISAYGGLGNNTFNIFKSSDKNIIFSKDDLSIDVDSVMIEEKFDDKMVVMDEDMADLHMSENAPGALVSYVVAPFDPESGSYYYKMLIDSETHKLYYFRKHKISKKSGYGFLPEDIMRITATRK